MSSFLLGFNDHIVHVDLDILADLFLKAGLHAPLIDGASVLQPEGHGVVAVNPERRDKAHFLLVFHLHMNLVVV